MLSSACSLRCTQCATLIALASAAGIMRIEPTQSTGTRTPTPNTAVGSRTCEWVDRSSASHFEVAVAAIAPWCRLIQVASDLVSDAAVKATVALPPPAGTTERVSVLWGAPAPSAREHAFPFAVGPPPRGATWNPRADDTVVSGDSVARGSIVSRVAAGLYLNFSARSTRIGNPVAIWTGLLSESGSALRGEPGGLPSLIALLDPAGLRAGRSGRAAIKSFLIKP